MLSQFLLALAQAARAGIVRSEIKRYAPDENGNQVPVTGSYVTGFDWEEFATSLENAANKDKPGVGDGLP